MTEKKINIKSERSPSRRHVRFVSILERQAYAAYNIAMNAMLVELEETLRQERLMKSDKKLGSGWTGEVPTISLNIGESVSKIVNKYMGALRWVMLGDYAGKDAKKTAKNLGFVDKVTPGSLQSSYLNSLDMHRESYIDATGDTPADIPKYLLEGSIEQIVAKSNRYFKQFTLQIENLITNSMNMLIESLNSQNTTKANKEAFKTLANTEGLGSEEATETASKGLRSQIPKSWFNTEVKQVVRDSRHKWKTAVRSELGLASAAATHQAIQEIYGGNDDGMRVIWLTSKRESVCKFCNGQSMNPDGSFKYYTMKDFKPSGYNIGKKRADWGRAIPPSHPNCACRLVYVPAGFEVDSDGGLVVKK